MDSDTAAADAFEDSRMREAVARTLADDTAAAFMARHAGFGYFRGSETPADGLRRTAVDLATAERWAEDRGYVVRWSDDWGVGDHRAEYGDAYDDWAEGSHTCENADLVDPDSGDVLASLGCIDDADADYRRVVGAELAAEASGRFIRAITA